MIKDVKGKSKGTHAVPLPKWAVKALKAQIKACPTVPVTMPRVHRDKTEKQITARLIFHGEGIGLTRERVRQLEKHALAKLRDPERHDPLPAWAS